MICQRTAVLGVLVLSFLAVSVWAQPQPYTIIDGPGTGQMIYTFPGNVVVGPNPGTVGSIESHGGGCPVAPVNFGGNVINTDHHFHGNLNGVPDPNVVGCGWGRTAATAALVMPNLGNFPQTSTEQIALTEDSPARRHQFLKDTGGIGYREDVVMSAIWSAILDPEVDRSHLNQAATQNLRDIGELDADFFAAQAESAQDYAQQNAAVTTQRNEFQSRIATREIQQYYHRMGLNITGYVVMIADGYTDFSGMTISVQMKEHLAVLKTGYLGQLHQSLLGLAPYLHGNGVQPEGSFLTMPIDEALRSLNDLNNQLRRLREQDPNDPQIAVLEAERAKIWQINGIFGDDPESQQQLAQNREQLLGRQFPVAQDINTKYDAWVTARDRAAALDLRILGHTDRATGDPSSGEIFAPGSVSDEEIDGWKTELAELNTQLPGLRQAYLDSIDRQGLLLTEIEIGAFTGPFWDWLAEHGTDHALSDAALELALNNYVTNGQNQIQRLSDTTDGQGLITFFGPDYMAPYRNQMAGSDLKQYFPGLDAGMGQISSYWDAYNKSEEFERQLHDTVIAIDQGVLAISMILVPPSAAVLGPIALGLTAGDIGLQGYRLYVATEALEQAEGVVATGVGTSRAGLQYFHDWQNAQAVTFALTVGLSIFDLDDAARGFKTMLTRKGPLKLRIWFRIMPRRSQGSPRTAMRSSWSGRSIHTRLT